MVHSLLPCCRRIHPTGAGDGARPPARHSRCSPCSKDPAHRHLSNRFGTDVSAAPCNRFLHDVRQERSHAVGPCKARAGKQILQSGFDHCCGRELQFFVRAQDHLELSVCVELCVSCYPLFHRVTRFRPRNLVSSALCPRLPRLSMTATDWITDAFPGEENRVRELRATDRHFREACEDFVELSELIETMRSSAEKNRCPIEDASASLAEVRLELETRLSR